MYVFADTSELTIVLHVSLRIFIYHVKSANVGDSPRIPSKLTRIFQTNLTLTLTLTLILTLAPATIIAVTIAC